MEDAALVERQAEAERQKQPPSVDLAVEQAQVEVRAAVIFGPAHLPDRASEVGHVDAAVGAARPAMFLGARFTHVGHHEAGSRREGSERVHHADGGVGGLRLGAARGAVGVHDDEADVVPGDLGPEGRRVVRQGARHRPVEDARSAVTPEPREQSREPVLVLLEAGFVVEVEHRRGA
jgi:hypothetical protein